MSAVCGVVTFLGPCPFPAVATVAMGCVHEHMRVGPMCEGHEQEAHVPETGYCRACFDGATSHDCGLSFIDSKPLAVAA